MIINNHFSSPTIGLDLKRQQVNTQSSPHAAIDSIAVNTIDKNRDEKQGLSSLEYEKLAVAHQQTKTIYDNPQGGQRLAISEYQSVFYAAKREEVQRLVGIDTFA